MKLPLVVGFLAFAVVASALGVVYAKHQSRKLFVQLNTLEKSRDEMNVEWGRLQLEQSTWATHGRIERVARERLHMTHVEYDKVIIVKP